MKKSVKMFSLFMVLTLVFSVFCANVSATTFEEVHDYFLHSQTVPLGQLTYYIDSSASGSATQIKAAMNAWSTASQGRISFTSSSASSATIVFKKQSTFPSGLSTTNGYVLYYSCGTSLNTPGGIPSQDWTKCEAYIKSGLTSAQTQRTACHEIGHCLGLAHPYKNSTLTSSIMYESGNSKASNTPTPGDITNLEEKYPGPWHW